MFSAFGCPSLKQPEGTRVSYDDNVAEVTCGGSTGKTWKVICQNGKWVGDLGNCTKSKHSIL